MTYLLVVSGSVVQDGTIVSVVAVALVIRRTSPVPVPPTILIHIPIGLEELFCAVGKVLLLSETSPDRKPGMPYAVLFEAAVPEPEYEASCTGDPPFQDKDILVALATVHVRDIPDWGAV